MTDANTSDHNSGICNSGDYNSGNRNSGSCNSGSCNSGYYNSGDYNSGDYNSGDYNSGSCNSGGWNSGGRNPGDRNSGFFNSGDYNSGYFNSNSPKVRIFNMDSGLDFGSDILFRVRDIVFNNIKLVCIWVESGDMTKEEKEQNPSHETTGGYLKERDYKYCWKKGWAKMSEEDKGVIKSLPNFDADIFKEITGVDVREDQRKTISLSGVEISLTQEDYDKIKKEFEGE